MGWGGGEREREGNRVRERNCKREKPRERMCVCMGLCVNMEGGA